MKTNSLTGREILPSGYSSFFRSISFDYNLIKKGITVYIRLSKEAMRYERFTEQTV